MGAESIHMLVSTLQATVDKRDRILGGFPRLKKNGDKKRYVALHERKSMDPRHN
ncbi:hypothetical protein RchiOBHm_Chr1g0326621 [Rosa chinensis]|uniref:Uncharacterized protein n=1 Tax=Rosa chinensis TaxID=74649 RepID=A0A2P6SAB3_ROSCH|nr:hypothetical protein RchiOBHm_Chr1g0326621 [Rosa chinensis]